MGEGSAGVGPLGPTGDRARGAFKLNGRWAVEGPFQFPVGGAAQWAFLGSPLVPSVALFPCVFFLPRFALTPKHPNVGDFPSFSLFFFWNGIVNIAYLYRTSKPQKSSALLSDRTRMTCERDRWPVHVSTADSHVPATNWKHDRWSVVVWEQGRWIPRTMSAIGAYRGTIFIISRTTFTMQIKIISSSEDSKCTAHGAPWPLTVSFPQQWYMTIKEEITVLHEQILLFIILCFK